MTHRQRLAALFGAAILLAGAAGYAVSQTISVPTEARVIVQKHPSGAVEVALEQGGERYLPQARFVSRDAETGRWLRSSAVTIEVDVPEPEPEVVEVEKIEKIVEVEVEKIEPPVVPLEVASSAGPSRPALRSRGRRSVLPRSGG